MRSVQHLNNGLAGILLSIGQLYALMSSVPTSGGRGSVALVVKVQAGLRMPDLTHPTAVMNRLAEIEADLANRQGALESAARNWFRAKRDREKERAIVFINAHGTVAERNAQADRETCLNGVEAEAEWEALKAVTRTLETRASIGQTLLRVLNNGLPTRRPVLLNVTAPPTSRADWAMSYPRTQGRDDSPRLRL